jgi:hypothetical protein
MRSLAICAIPLLLLSHIETKNIMPVQQRPRDNLKNLACANRSRLGHMLVQQKAAPFSSLSLRLAFRVWQIFSPFASPGLPA